MNNKYGKIPADSGLVRLRNMGMSRRQFGKSILGSAVAGMTIGLPLRASAATGISYMGWQGYDDAAKVGGFLESNDMYLDITYMESQEMLYTAHGSGGRGNLDLSTPVDFHMPYMVAAGLWEPLDMSLIPNISEMFPDFIDMPNLNIDGKSYGVPFAWGSLPLMYNADVIKEAPTSWWDLMDPKYKGKATVTEDSTGVLMTFAMMATGTRTPWNLTKEMAEKTLELMVKFKKEQALTIAPGYGELVSLLASGEVVICQGWEPVSQWTGEDSPPIKWAYPKEGVVNFVDTYAIFADAPNIELDHKILNHVISAEAQAANAEVNACAVTNKNAVSLLTDTTRAFYPYDDVPGWFERAGGHYSMFPEDDSEYLSYDQLLEYWEDFLKA